MPRRNRTPQPDRHSFAPLSHSKPKRAFDTKQQAEQAAKEATRYNLDLSLYVYQSPTDGKWYLSSKSAGSSK